MSVRGGWDERSSYRESPQRYTTVKRYTIPRTEEEDRVSIVARERISERPFEETRIIRRERSRTPPEPRPEREIRIERYERAPEPEPRRYEREYRYERDLEREPRREPYELERYIKSTEYFPPAPRAPLVVPQPREEEDFQIVRRSEVIDDRQIARRSPPREEDYYYERRTRKVEDDRSDDDYRSERVRRGRTVSPNDSVSQHGRRRDYSSDDSMVYVKKEVREERGESPSRRRHLAEGAIAGIGAAELLRHHRKREGEEVSSRSSRIGRDVGAAALGAVGAEVISRAKSRRRSKSRSTRYESPERESRRKHRHGHRSRSRSRVKQLAGLGLGAAAIAAVAGYVKHKNNQKNEQDDRRSRSRTRRHSTSEVNENGPQNQNHRNTRMAQAGLAGAAIAGLVERARSKSRTRDGRSESKSRIRTGLPIAAAGLGSAAIAGLYEKNQAKKQEAEARESAARVGRRRSRSRSMSAAMPYEGPRAASASDPGLIEYGEAPVYSNAGVPDYYNRPASQAGYYGPPPDHLIAPAAAAGAAAATAAYLPTRVTETHERVIGGGERNLSRSREREMEREVERDGDGHGHRHRHRERRREDSGDSSDGERERRRRHRRKKSGEDERQRSRSQSRTREFATAAAAAGAAGIAANEYAKRKQRKKEEKERERMEAENRGYEEPYSPQEYLPANQPPPNIAAPIHSPENFYPMTNQFPPPPNAGFTPQANYNPAEYQPPPQQGGPNYANYGNTSGYTPPQGPYSPGDSYSGPPGRNRRGDENVSAEPYLNTNHPGATPDPRNVEEGLRTPRNPSPKAHPRASSQPAPSNKSVQFDNSVPDIAQQSRNRRQRSSRNDTNSYDSESSLDDRRRRRNRRSRNHDVDSRSPSPADSDETIDLPERFDRNGRRKVEKGEDPIAAKIEEFLSGKGSAGKIFKNLTDGLLGGGGDGDKGSRRRRRRNS